MLSKLSVILLVLPQHVHHKNVFRGLQLEKTSDGVGGVDGGISRHDRCRLTLKNPEMADHDLEANHFDPVWGFMLTTAFLPLLLFPLALAYPKGGIEQQVYDNLVRYTKYSSAVYQKLCLRPLGNTLVAQVRTLYLVLLNHANIVKRGVLVF
jgi:hypothetical protein